ncbi:HTH-type transcriptional regulator YhaJ [Pseudidiomarina piscicola]|uniref:HTH-type transcriptional regulator YhaJ n=1 Tax=Pseudidiomarina piscicola TaxID=2614830 RepID=A0A6S6WRE8_9GAMM|nr:LysR family transcriptional regulator [Pseudidiomarina piscicola]CAB0150759.1 HTH-type transcriptional regulator YhaJ [Pseudidiomarina piscicola]VZT40264.1 HTH-type transcriptional regulator YhaJ [Pseudomonas aeruginosa]
MLKVTLEQWRMFYSVVEYGGFNQASQGVYKSQSSIHNAVGKIEQSLGVKLFKIEGRKTVLTEAGELMLRRAKLLLEEARDVEAIALTLSRGVETSLKIAVDEVFPRALLYSALEQVSHLYPLVQVEVVESILSGSSELLADDDVEIAISPFHSGAGFNESLCHVVFVAVASPLHPLNTLERKLTLDDLKSHRQIVVRDSSHGAKESQANDGWLKADKRWTVSHFQTSIDMICKGLGFAWLPLNLIEEQLEGGRLQPLPLQENAKRYAQLYLTFKDGDRLGPAAKSFVEALRVQCQSLPEA